MEKYIKDIENRINRLENGSTINRLNIPRSMMRYGAEYDKEKWRDQTFYMGIEYGYLLALYDILNERDSVGG